MHDVYVTADGARYADIVRQPQARGIRVHRGLAEVLDAMSPDAPADRRRRRPAGRLTRRVLAGPPRLVAVLSNVRDPVTRAR